MAATGWQHQDEKVHGMKKCWLISIDQNGKLSSNFDRAADIFGKFIQIKLLKGINCCCRIVSHRATPNLAALSYVFLACQAVNVLFVCFGCVLSQSCAWYAACHCQPVARLVKQAARKRGNQPGREVCGRVLSLLLLSLPACQTDEFAAGRVEPNLFINMRLQRDRCE